MSDRRIATYPTLILTAFLAVTFFTCLAQGQTHKILWSFSGGSDGSEPIGTLVQDTAGNLYGPTLNGGTHGLGVVFKLTKSGKERVLHSFKGGTDGSNPAAGLIRDAADNLYGTTNAGGTSGFGVVFRLDSSNNETVLHTFSGGADGAAAPSGVIEDGAGNLFGITYYGGAYGAGTIFKLAPSGDESVRDEAGNFYGAARGGGGPGEVFELMSSGTEKVLHAFGGPDGSDPRGNLVRDGDGNLYGTAFYGGAFGYGIVFKLDTSGNETLLYSFSGGADGANPQSGLVGDGSGNFYGTTYNGGAYGFGVVFKLDSGGNESVLYSFAGGADGANPYGGLIRDTAGDLYGTTHGGGVAGHGTVFEIPGASIPFLGFPLLNKTAYTADINAVFDHSMDIAPQDPIQWGYCPDEIVTAYTGEQGTGQFSSSLVGTFLCGKPKSHSVQLYGYQQVNAKPFSVNGQYVGGLNANAQAYLFYDGHPGFDYRTTDQDGAGNLCGSPDCNSSGETPIVAAAAGTVVCVNISTKIKAPCIEGPGEIKIQHSDGYYTVYLHLSSATVSTDASVAAQQQIGISGSTGAPEGGAHLHFEVRQGTIPVDPYGWSGAGEDPYTRAVNIKLWQ
jgi:uncharacterized repeat protein (TIGR03803 family)